MISEVQLLHTSTGGSLLKSDATLEYKDGRIWFLKSAFALKDEIKAMAGSKWHGYSDPPQKIWSVADCQRNRFQLSFLTGEDVYQWFDREVIKHEYQRPLRDYQRELADHFLTYHYGIMAAEMGLGKTLATQEVIEQSGVDDPWWIGPKTSLPNIKREFKKWELDPSINVEMLNYEALVRVMEEWTPETPVPRMLICDESSRCKSATAQRTQAVQKLADIIREKYGFDGYVIEMSGSPSPKKPTEWWAQTEVAWPGYLKEGSPKAMEQRLAFMELAQYDAGAFNKRNGWRDDERKCQHCGHYEDEKHDGHQYEPSINEVSYLYERLKGLVIIKRQADCLELPEKQYRIVECKPNASTLRVAQMISDAAPNAITGATYLRELSDGFQYREEADGTTTCPHCNGKKTVTEWFDPNSDRVFGDISMFTCEVSANLLERQVECPRCRGAGEVDKTIRVAHEVPCPKDKALRELMDECEETGRIVVWAGFTGSIDRIVRLCHKEGWSVVRCDGRGWQVTNQDGEVVLDEEPLDYWGNTEGHPRVAFVSQPESGGMSLTLIEARMEVYWSNSFKAEYRTQSEARIWRLGQTRGVWIVDLFHLPTDARVLDVIRENRRIELMTMGELTQGVNWSSNE